MSTNTPTRQLRAGMVGVGMIFEDTYWPFFHQAHAHGLYRRDIGPFDVPLVALASRTGSRAARWIADASKLGMPPIANCTGPTSLADLLAKGIDAVCIPTPAA